MYKADLAMYKNNVLQIVPGQIFTPICWQLVVLSPIDLDNQCVYEPRREKTGLRGFRPGLTQTNLYIHRRRIEA